MVNKLWLALAILVQGCGGFLAVAQERIDKPFTVGQLGYIEHTEPCEWLTFDDVEWTAEASGRVYFATKPGKFKIAAMSPTKANKVLAFYTITVGDGQPVPVPPIPVPPIPVPPAPVPIPVPIATWSEQIRLWTEALPVTQRQQAPQVKVAFEKVAAAIGVTAFTGPDIRTETAKALSVIPGFAGWAAWDTQRTDADAVWARESYRDAAAYKQRWAEVIAGLALVKPPPQAVTEFPTVIQGVQVMLDSGRHQIRNGRLLEYRCPANGQRCRWQDMGSVVSRGAGWVIVQ